MNSDTLIGTQIGSYRITRLLGEGGMGSVWEGQHVQLQRKAAIKVLHPFHARNTQFRERFIREGTALERIKHPGIVELYDIVETNGNIALVMEYVEGITLEEWILRHTGPLPNDSLANIFQQILKAIGHAHAQKIVHRDIKPSNFMITPDGTVKVLDFGIAKWLNEDHKLTKTGTQMGTTLYMSPEQVEGKALDFRSDIYSLGVLLFFLSTGKSPYEGLESEFQVYQKIVREQLPEPSAFYPGVPNWAIKVIRKSTAKQPNDRFLSCEQLFGEIVQPKALKPPTSTPQTPPSTKKPPSNSTHTTSRTITDSEADELIGSYFITGIISLAINIFLLVLGIVFKEWTLIVLPIFMFAPARKFVFGGKGGRWDILIRFPLFLGLTIYILNENGVHFWKRLIPSVPFAYHYWITIAVIANLVLGIVSVISSSRFERYQKALEKDMNKGKEG